MQTPRWKYSQPFQHYTDLRKIGGGGIAEVYYGRNARAQHGYALKVLRSQYAEDPDALIRFRDEAVIHESLVHPCIVEAFDFREDEERPFLVLAFADEGNLAGRIQWRIDHGELPFDPPRALSFLKPICDALDYAHAEVPPIYHCDVKPANILIADRGDRVLLSDFGIAKLAGSRVMEGAPFGTAPYMAPEQCDACWGPIGPYTDVYALGIILYEILTLRRPFRGEQAPFDGTTKERIRWEQQNLPPCPPQQLNDAIPVWLNQAILQALEKEPARRQQSPSEFYDDISFHERIRPAAVVAETVLPADIPSGGPEHTSSTSVIPNRPKRRGPLDRLRRWRDERVRRRRGLSVNWAGYLEWAGPEPREDKVWIGNYEITIGRRSDCTVRLDDRRVSRMHARVFVSGGNVYIQDLRSTNGLSVNGIETASACLGDGDLIAIGSTVFRFRRFQQRPVKVRMRRKK